MFKQVNITDILYDKIIEKYIYDAYNLIVLRNTPQTHWSNSMAEELLLTPEEAFKSIKVKRAKGYQMIASGELLSIKIGRLRRVPVDSLRQWIESKMEEANSGDDAG